MAYVAAGNSAEKEDFDRLTLILRAVCAWLWIVCGLLLIVRQVEISFGVLSGFCLLIGPYPAVIGCLAIVFGGAAYIASVTHAGLWLHRVLWWLRFGWRPRATQTVTVEATAPQPEWTVRTQPRTQTQRRSSASQRVMDMEL